MFVDDASAPGRERFWGFVTALVHVGGLVEASRLGQLDEAGYDWELSRVDPEDGTTLRFAGSERASPADPVAFAVVVPSGEWQLQLAPSGGWGAEGWAFIQSLGAAAIAVLCGTFAYIVLRQPALLRREVDERTAELARANALLAESQKIDSIGRLAGGIAHDFNNLLTVDPERRGGAPGRICARAAFAPRTWTRSGPPRERARDLTAQLLAFARRQMHQPRGARPERGAARDGEAAAARARRGRGSSPRSRAGLWPVRGDRGQLEQVILNLTVNARDAMPTGGTLGLETENMTVGADAAALGVACPAAGSASPCATPATAWTPRGARPPLRAVLHDQADGAGAPASGSRPCTAS